MATEVVTVMVGEVPENCQEEPGGDLTTTELTESPVDESGNISYGITLANDSSAQGAEMLIRLKEGTGYIYPVPQGYIANMANTQEVEFGQGDVPRTDAALTELGSDNSYQETGYGIQTCNSVAVQANDYEIERRSGVVPARRRLIPFKFRDFRNSEDITLEDPGDEDYDPEEEEPLKKPRKTNPRPGARKVGRPRKVRNDHAYDRTGENQTENENGDKAEGGAEDGEAARDDKTKNKDRPFPRRGRPPKDDPHQQPKLFKCLQCGKRFSLKGNLKVHMRTHTDERPFKCMMAECGKAFRSNESLRRHTLSHQGIKLFGCDICQNKFSSNVALKEHMARHTDTKSHTCPVCERAFRQLSCLRRHITTHSDEQPHQCTLCDKRFSQAVYLRSHMRSHTGERPYRCDTCGKCFAHQSDKIRHMTIHLGTKPYVCEVCQARFSDPSTRRRHVREHTGFKPYTCQLCGDHFKRSGQLKAHLNKKHMNYKEDVVITKDGPFKALQFQFKGNKNTGVAEQLQAEQLTNGLQTKYVEHLDAASASGQEGQVITIAPTQGNIQVIDENGQIQHLQVQHVQAAEQADDQSQVLSQIQQQLAHSLGQSPLEGYQIILPESSNGNQEILNEETQKIIEQIHSQLDLPGDEQGRQQVKVAYQILHDDDNQQIVEIQYHQVEQEDVSPQGVVTRLDGENDTNNQNVEQQQHLQEQAYQQQQNQQQQHEQIQNYQLQEQMKQHLVKPEQSNQQHMQYKEEFEQKMLQEQQEMQLQENHLQEQQLHQEFPEEQARQAQHEQLQQLKEESIHQQQHQQIQQQQEQVEVQSVELIDAVQRMEADQETGNMQIVTLEQQSEKLSFQQNEPSISEKGVSGQVLEPQVKNLNQIQEFDQHVQLAEETFSQVREPSQNENFESAKINCCTDSENVSLETQETVLKPVQDLSQENQNYSSPDKQNSEKTVDSSEATLLTLQNLEENQQQYSVDYVSNPDFGCQEYYNWLSNFTELCKLVPMPLDVDLFQKISQVHKTLSDVLATPRGILTNKENFRTLMNISKELNGIINEHLNFVLQRLDTDIDIE